MNITQIFRAGNSEVVALNPIFKEEHGFKVGTKVVQENTAEGILIKPVEKTVKKESKKGTKSDSEFKRWWQMFLEENGGILDDLA